MKKDYGQIFKELVESVGYELLGEYKNIKTIVNLKCPEGHIWNVRPYNFKVGNRCPKCSGNYPVRAKESFNKLLEKEGYELLSEYVNTHTPVKVICDKGHEWDIRPASFKKGARCPKCGFLKTKTKEK